MQAILGQFTSLGNRRRDMCKGFIHDSAERRNSVPVRLQLLVSPDRFKALYKIGRCHDVETKTADQLDRSGIDPRQIGDGIEGGILHGDSPATPQ